MGRCVVLQRQRLTVEFNRLWPCRFQRTDLRHSPQGECDQRPAGGLDHSWIPRLDRVALCLDPPLKFLEGQSLAFQRSWLLGWGGWLLSALWLRLAGKSRKRRDP